MICREQDGTLVMTKQHEHGLLAGEFAKWFKEEHTPAEGRRAEVLWAVSNHDRGWIDLDETPFWNDAEGLPYSFLDFPVVPKLTFIDGESMRWKRRRHTGRCCAVRILNG